jgi:hypothetical protein
MRDHALALVPCMCLVALGEAASPAALVQQVRADHMQATLARKEFQELWLDVCLEANALDSGDSGFALASPDSLLDR